MIYFKRKNGTVFGKEDPTANQLEAYKKAGHKICAESGKSFKPKPKKKGKNNA